MKKISMCFVVILASVFITNVQALLIDLGQINLTGDFTLNHNYNFNQRPAVIPFGTFGTMTVASATGIFAPIVGVGDTLVMNSATLVGPTTPEDSHLQSPMIWNVDGVTFSTEYAHFAGPPYSMLAVGTSNISFYGFDPSVYALGVYSGWQFLTPSFEHFFSADITGPINLQMFLQYEDGRKLVQPPLTVPDAGSTVVLLGIALGGLGFMRYRW